MLIINFILFQISWFACVIGAARGYPLLGVSITIITLFWHLFQSKQPKFEFLLIVIVLMLGGLFDQFLLSMSLINYQSNGWDSSFVPVWILALWTAFASTLNLSLSWMHDRYLISTLFGAIGGALAFLGAQQLGGVSLLEKDIAKRRPEYENYVSTTNAFIPGLPKGLPK